MSVGKKLKLLRRKKISLVELAERLNFSIKKDEQDHITFNKGKLSKWKNDREEPKLSAIKYVADFYRVSIDSIINTEEKKN